MNDLADSEANCARRAWAERSDELPLDVYGEEDYHMSVSGIPVMGSYKEAVLRRLQRVEVNKWMYPTGRPVPRRTAAGRMSAQAGNDVPRGNRRGARPDPPTTSSPGLYPAMMKPLRPTAQHTSRLIRSNWPGVLSPNAAARSCRDADLTRFWLLLAAEWLPVERRLVVAKKAGARDDSCKLCGLGVDTSLSARTPRSRRSVDASSLEHWAS